MPLAMAAAPLIVAALILVAAALIVANLLLARAKARESAQADYSRFHPVDDDED